MLRAFLKRFQNYVAHPEAAPYCRASLFRAVFTILLSPTVTAGPHHCPCQPLNNWVAFFLTAWPRTGDSLRGFVHPSVHLDASISPSVSYTQVVNPGTLFLGATKHLYNWLCPSVGWSVGRSVGRLVCGVTHSFDDPHNLALFFCEFFKI